MTGSESSTNSFQLSFASIKFYYEIPMPEIQIHASSHYIISWVCEWRMCSVRLKDLSAFNNSAWFSLINYRDLYLFHFFFLFIFFQKFCVGMYYFIWNQRHRSHGHLFNRHKLCLNDTINWISWSCDKRMFHFISASGFPFQFHTVLVFVFVF